MNDKKTVKVLQIAGFDGNIGDIANHNGFRASLTRYFPERSFRFDDLEMRSFYKSAGINRFDPRFASMANEYDLVVIGGGGFFDLRWDYSDTGTTIDLPEEISAMIKTPILFNCLGYWERVADGSLYEKFEDFLKRTISNDRMFLTVRNDGSYESIVSRYPFAEGKIREIPDGGFFCSPPKQSIPR